MINVLLSTYNGEKYIRDLIESVLNQKNVNLILTIRDDGSKDRTVQIIKSFKDDRIRLIEGNNLGPRDSFLKLLDICEDADYYAYCDQDDIWKLNKLDIAVCELKNVNSEPCLFVSACDVFSDKKSYNFKRNMNYDNKLKIETTLTYRCPSGCLMVFNRQLKEKIKTQNVNARMHDFWTLLVAFAVNARIITCDESLINYRIHGQNAVGLEKNYYKKIKRLIKSVTNNKNERQRQAICLYENYKDDMSDSDKEKVMKIIDYKRSFKNRLKLMFDKNYGDGIYIRFVFALSIFFGVF